LNRTRDQGNGSDLYFSACLGLGALLPRLYVAIAWPREPVWDGHYYDFGARRIAAGYGYSDGIGGWHPWCHWPVGYSGVLAAAYRAFGSGPHVATLLNAVIGALLAVLTHRLARYELSPVRARVAGLLCALHPGLIAYAALVMTESLSALVLVLAGFLWVRDQHRHARRGAVLFGLTIGAGALVHPSFLVYAPAIVVLSGDTLARSLRRSNLPKALTSGAIATACAFVPVLPWTLRNCRVMDRCTLLSTNGGWNLAIGSFARATGRFETLRASDGCAVVSGQVQQDECWRDLALATIKSDFGRWLGLVPKKLGFTFDHESFPVEYLHEADPDRWSEDRRRRGRALLTGAHRVWLTSAALGVAPVLGAARAVVAAARRSLSALTTGRVTILVSTAVLALVALVAWTSDSSPFYLLAIAMTFVGWLNSTAAGPVTRWALFCLAATIVTHAVFFGEDRYHIVLVPLLCVLSARAFAGHAEDTFNAPHDRKTAPTQGEELR